MSPKPLLCVVGARPNFMKMAPILRQLQSASPAIPSYLVHTGQHYDYPMNGQFFEQLGIRKPDIELNISGGNHAQQTAQILLAFDPVVEMLDPFAVLVVGDVNSTLACSLVASKRGVPLIHVEAGLRSHDRTMPEEINRVLTDQMADLLLTSERVASQQLLHEGVAAERIVFVGNVMIDSLRANLSRATPVQQTLQQAGISRSIESRHYALLTLHRPANVDNPHTLKQLLRCFEQLSQRLPVIFPLHPRTEQHLQQWGLLERLQASDIITLPPVGYVEMLGLMASAQLVLTDSGGVQEETTALGIPCLTLRDNTERPITVSEGTNSIVGSDPLAIEQAISDILSTGGKQGRIPEYWDGQAAARVVDAVVARYGHPQLA